METIIIKEKETSAINMSLEANGNAIDLSGIAYVRLDMIDSENKVYRYTSVDATSSLAIVTAATGAIRFTPYSGDMTIFRYQSQPYKIHVRVFETSNQNYVVPGEGWAEIKIEKEF